jgi:hypothetical protein
MVDLLGKRELTLDGRGLQGFMYRTEGKRTQTALTFHPRVDDETFLGLEDIVAGLGKQGWSPPHRNTASGSTILLPLLSTELHEMGSGDMPEPYFSTEHSALEGQKPAASFLAHVESTVVHECSSVTHVKVLVITVSGTKRTIQ